MRSIDVILCELKTVAKRVIDVSLCSKVHDGIDRLGDQKVVDEVGAPDIPLHKLEVGGRSGRVKILQIGTIVKLVKHNDLMMLRSSPAKDHKKDSPLKSQRIIKDSMRERCCFTDPQIDRIRHCFPANTIFKAFDPTILSDFISETWVAFPVTPFTIGYSYPFPDFTQSFFSLTDISYIQAIPMMWRVLHTLERIIEQQDLSLSHTRNLLIDPDPDQNLLSSGMATYEPKNILITGAAGFIASHVANRLIRNYPDYKIVVLDKLDYCSNLKNLNPSRSSPNFKFVKGDIGSADLVNYLLITESIDTIMHFAAQTHVDNSFGNSFEFTKNNIYGTHVLLEACKVTGQVRRFIHVSTDEVYGETEEDAVVGNHEASQLLPTNPYSATKAGAEMLVMAYGRSYGLPVITTRGNNVYGPNQFPEKLIPKFILLAMRGQPLPIHGDGSNVRSYLYCEDVAEAFEVILHKGEVGHVYNIGTKKERRVIDVAKDMCKLFNMDPDSSIKFVENRPFNDQRYFLADEKLKSLGWSERTVWEEGLKKTIEWYTSNPNWWGDVSGALLPHPRMLMMPGGVDRLVDGPENADFDSADVAINTSQIGVQIPSSKASGIAPKKPALKFLIYGKTG
ncbi:putative dTDP-glucose 4,6-dehydratase, NAD(P)-binding domain, NAD(P)-binding domain superfamily [Helianthus anomalus]